MPSQGHQAVAFPSGDYYVVYPDGAFTMPMPKRVARRVARVFGGLVKTTEITFTVRFAKPIAMLHKTLWLALVALISFWVGYRGTEAVSHLLAAYGFVQ